MRPAVFLAEGFTTGSTTSAAERPRYNPTYRAFGLSKSGLDQLKLSFYGSTKDDTKRQSWS